MGSFRKRPVEVEAWLYDGASQLPDDAPEWLKSAYRHRANPLEPDFRRVSP